MHCLRIKLWSIHNPVCFVYVCLCVLDWIAAVVGDERSALCKLCHVILPAHHAGLTKHCQNSQHLLRLASHKAPTNKTSTQNVSPTRVNSNRKLQVDCFTMFVDVMHSLLG